jgi:diaminopimelate epimerase
MPNMFMPYEIVIADPAKNITVFVLSPISGPANRAATAKALLADPRLGAEQVGFVIPPPPADPSGLWRLEMMGGEFCGNAARSFGLFVARQTGLTGKVKVPIEISGMEEPLTIHVDVEETRAEAAMPRPVNQSFLTFEGQSLPLLAFNGITHVIAPDFKPGKDIFYAIKDLVEKPGHIPAGALGVMFYDCASRFMTPAVYVYATDSLVFESSCGSGSAALGVWESREFQDGERCSNAAQPGGIIEVRVRKAGGEVTGVFIGGPVSLSGHIRSGV